MGPQPSSAALTSLHCSVPIESESPMPRHRLESNHDPFVRQVIRRALVSQPVLKSARGRWKALLVGLKGKSAKSARWLRGFGLGSESFPLPKYTSIERNRVDSFA